MLIQSKIFYNIIFQVSKNELLLTNNHKFDIKNSKTRNYLKVLFIGKKTLYM